MYDLSKGFKNITEPTLFNLLIVLTLGLIVYMVYLDTRKINLFTNITPLDVVNNYIASNNQNSLFQTDMTAIDNRIANAYTNIGRVFATFF